mgnify:CR=1 FL=1
MKRILGLDLGVSSIGWALVDEAEKTSEKSSIVKLGVRVNPLTVDEQGNFDIGKSITTNADRTLKRGARRNLQRYKLRRENLIDCFISNGIISDEAILCENGNRTTFETYRLRAKAVKEEVSLLEFARILLMINKKRGYKNNRKAKGTDEGVLLDGMSVAKVMYENNITPGQYVYERLCRNQKFIPEFYKSDLQSEFNKIYSFQRRFYPDVLTDNLYSEINGKGGRATAAIFNKKGIDVAENKGSDKKIAVYGWRSDAVSKQLSLEIIAYVLIDLNGAIDNGNNYLGAIGDRSKELYFNKMTVGQMLMKRLDENPNVSLKNLVFYRQDYLDEFERIWETQQKFHKKLTPQLKKEIRDIIIFYQRNLKSQKNRLAICELERKEVNAVVDGACKKRVVGRKVCPKSSPLFQEFKIWQVLNNLEVDDSETNEKWLLDIDETKKLFEELSVKPKMKKNEILKLLYPAKYRKLDLNYEEAPGNTTLSSIINACRSIIVSTGHDEYEFSKMPARDIFERIETIFAAVGFKSDFLHFNSEADKIEDEPMFKLWHLLYSYTDDNSKTGNESLVKKIVALTNMDDESARILAGVVFADDYGSLCSKALSKILPHMKEGTEYSLACTYAGYKHSQQSLTSEELDKKVYVDTLELLPRNSLRNPVVEKILNQMVNVINTIVTEYGKPDEIRIELARELKSSAKERKDATDSINTANKNNERVRGILRQEFGIQNPSKNDIVRYRLYEELKDNGYKTLYSGTYIEKDKLFSANFNVEHIIPQAKLFDDSFSNKTLEATSVNIEKGKETAYDYILSKKDKEGVEQYKNCVSTLYKRGAIGKAKRDKLLMLGKDIPTDFIERDLRNTQYIARKAQEILKTLVRDVVATSGKITARLREDWKLVDVMQELNWEKYKKQGLVETIVNREGKELRRIKDWTKRNDHRHHAVDALVVAFCKRSIVQYFNTLNANEELFRDRHNKLRFKEPVVDFRNEAKRHLENILVSIKSKNKVVTINANKSKTSNGEYKVKKQLTPRGQLHLETIYGRISQYACSYEKVGSSFDIEKIAKVANKRQRDALLARLIEFDGNPKSAFCGKNSLEKNPIYVDSQRQEVVPEKVKLVEFEDVYTIRKNVDDKLSVDKVVDARIKKVLQARLAEYGNDPKLAFTNLAENPIWLNKEKGIDIKRVTIKEGVTPVPLHDKKDHLGNLLLDKNGKKQNVDFVKTGSNHHVAIYIDENGKYQECIVSYFDAVARAINKQPVIDRDYNAALGWKFCFSMKQNEYFVFPDEATGFYPEDIELTNPDNFKIISPNLYRVQKLSSKYYCFRHHLETNVEDNNALKDITWKRITSLQNLKGAVKVRVNHIGNIVHVGE